ncbi:O-antigen ligase family protein [Aliiroseovarius sp.]|uniref:O-antigen ligase family protein n=1 Tax=Aliiroseovarius sp. TaxID=1872442 RepID=UPI003BAB02DE
MRRLLRYVEYLVAWGGLFFMSRTFTTYLTPEGSESAPMVQLIGALLGVYAVLALLLHRQAVARILGLYWPVLVPVGLAVLSLGWSEDPNLSLRRAGSLVLTTAFAFWLVLRFTPQRFFAMLLTVCIGLVVMNFVVIQTDPLIGIHQVEDLNDAGHAGSWRGLFGHKNDFGRLMALCVSVLFAGVVLRAGGRLGQAVLLSVTVLGLFMILKSNSSQAQLMAAVILPTTAVLFAMRRMSAAGRAVLMLLGLPFAVISALSVQIIFVSVLGILGKDATLTGRTTIWEGVLVSMQDMMVFGGGYGAGWAVVGPGLLALTGSDVGHAHNGYLDLAVDIGFFGLGMVLVLFGWLAVMAFRNLMNGVRVEISVLGLVIVLFAFVGNWAGSFFLLHNTLYWVLPVVGFAMLRDAPYGSPAPRPTSDPFGVLKLGRRRALTTGVT